MGKMRDTKGITLVALVITIIVLLILAGVTISMVLGENGIIGRAQDAANKTAEAQQNEAEALNSINWDEYLNGTGGSSLGTADGSYSEAKGVNTPKVNTSEMIPIKWNGSSWVICSTSDTEWYSYDGSSNKWANIMLSDGTYGASTAVETTVAESELRKYVCMDTKICI